MFELATHCRNRIWGEFASAWHEILQDLRQTDHLSDKEVRALEFIDLRADKPRVAGHMHRIYNSIKKEEVCPSAG